jgi:hypothetical protein
MLNFIVEKLKNQSIIIIDLNYNTILYIIVWLYENDIDNKNVTSVESYKNDVNLKSLVDFFAIFIYKEGISYHFGFRPKLINDISDYDGDMFLRYVKLHKLNNNIKL